MKSKGPINPAPPGGEFYIAVGGSIVGNSNIVVGGNATGNAFGAGSHVDNGIHIGRDNNGSVGHGQSLNHVSTMINQQDQCEKKVLLETLQQDVEALIKALPADKKDKESEIIDDLKMVVEQATSEKPNRKWYSVSSEGLLEASKWVKDFTGNIAGTIGQLTKLVIS